eukprot:g2100.t1
MKKAVEATSDEDAEIRYWREQLKKLSTQRAARKEEEEQVREKEEEGVFRIYVVTKCISIYRSIALFLEKRGGWTPVRSPQHADLILSAHTNRGKKRGMVAGGINFSFLNENRNRPLLNCYRRFELVCEKSDQAIAMKRYCDFKDIPSSKYMPETFVFRKECTTKLKTETTAVFASKTAEMSKQNREEATRFAAAHEKWKKHTKSVWIIKPSGGHCGEDILIERDLKSLLAAIRKMTRDTPAIVQKYVERPLIVSGGRKFDIRAWVALDSRYRIGLYREGVLRTTAVPYDSSLSDLSDRFAHLSNHCIAVTHSDYGKYEPTNEMWWGDFDRWLRRVHGKSFYDDLYPQIREIARVALLAVKEKVALDTKHCSFRSFHLFGFDLIVTDDFRVLLLEINSSPAVAADLMAGMTEDLVSFAIDPLYPMKRTAVKSERAAFEIAQEAAKISAKYEFSAAGTGSRSFLRGFDVLC